MMGKMNLQPWPTIRHHEGGQAGRKGTAGSLQMIPYGVVVNRMNEDKSQRLDLEQYSICSLSEKKYFPITKSTHLACNPLLLTITAYYWNAPICRLLKNNIVGFKDWIASCWILSFNEMAMYQLVMDMVVHE